MSGCHFVSSTNEWIVSLYLTFLLVRPNVFFKTADAVIRKYLNEQGSDRLKYKCGTSIMK